MLFFICGAGAGMLILFLSYKLKKKSFEKLASEIIERAEKEADQRSARLEIDLKQKELEHRSALEKLSEQKMQKISLREEKLDRQLALFEKKIQEVEKKEKELSKLTFKNEEQEKHNQHQNEVLKTSLEALAGMNVQEAKKEMVDRFAAQAQAECASLLYKHKQHSDFEAERYAASIITTAINRLSVATVSEVSVVTVALPSAEIKGRVIGREGRNIRLLEQVTGVNIVVDDTPNAIVISGFDPIRKEIARLALKELIQDGRIHPTRIEEAVALAETKIQSQIINYGEEAAIKAGSLAFHPEIIKLLGKLHFRYSYGQNVLEHSLEVSHLMGMMATELKLDVERAKKIGLLHDIGKAVSHEMEGSHALIGEQFALSYGESEEVANGIGCHHDEIKPTSIEAALCSAADKISGARPGARVEALEQYIKRSVKLEQLSYQFEGVEKAYALHAGRELRVIVEPEKFDDASTLLLARNIAQKIEKEMSYPGKIKVTVIREKRVIEYAS